MDEQRMRQIVREELAFFYRSDKFILERPVNLKEGVNVILGSRNGTKIGTEDTQKLALWGATPIIQPTSPAEPTGGATVDDQVRSSFNGLRSVLISTGIIKA